jgi:ribosomal protein L22
MADVSNTQTAAKVVGKRKAFDMTELTAKAATFVQSAQKADYKSLQKEFNINPARTSSLLKRLQTKGLVLRGKRRRWVVLVNQDGSKKPADQIPTPRRFKKPKHKKTAATQGSAAPAVTKVLKKASANAEHVTNVVTSAEKLKLVNDIASKINGRSRDVLLLVASDLQVYYDSEELLALFGK